MSQSSIEAINIKDNDWFSDLTGLEIDRTFYKKLILALKVTIDKFKQDY